MSVVRIFVPTFRRPALLPRALSSLCTQTFTDWVCELHNDAPDDDGPAQLVASFADPRIRLCQHDRNWGPVAFFNHAFSGAPEPFASILEDDNWWEPRFLEQMLINAKRYPDSDVFWSNLRLWQERSDGTFANTGKLAHRVDNTQNEAHLVPWGQREQIFGSLHSNGALLYRSRAVIPPLPIDLPFGAMEAFRDRVLPFPLIFEPAALANFSITRATARSRNPTEWTEIQVMLAATYLKAAGPTEAELHILWTECQAARPRTTSVLLLAGFVEHGAKPIRRVARAKDWYWLARSLSRRPGTLLRILSSRRRHPAWWRFLESETARQFALSRHAA